MRRFYLDLEEEDRIVAIGVKLPGGSVALEWLDEEKAAFHPSVEEIENITKKPLKLVWYDK